MKKLFSLLIIFTFFQTAGYAQHYLFYLHGKIVEDQGTKAFDSVNGFGKYDYEGICAAFRKEKFIVISEYRKPNTIVKEYAYKVVRQVDSLVKRGVKPNDITIVGASKGAQIAMFVSSFLKQKDVNFVFLSSCNDYVLRQNPEINFCGNILSIFEQSDNIGSSCENFKLRSNQSIPHYKEIMLHTGLRHGYIYRPLPEWVRPTLAWAGNQYN